jgi:Leucine-rich repeat (LRR) protein
MKYFVGICLILFNYCVFSQNDTIKVIKWEIAKNLHPDSVAGISFSKLNIKKLPSELEKYSKISVLDLSNNKLKELPSYLNSFQALTKIDLSKNKFNTLPDVVYDLKNLNVLIMNKNKISFLDEKIIQLSQLKYIDFWDNPMEKFPNAFIEMKKLKIIHAEGIRYGPKFQVYWKEILPNTQLFFDAPCDCMESN